MNRQVLEESKSAVTQGIKKELKITSDDFRKYEREVNREKKKSFLDEMDKKMRENNHQHDA